MRRGAIIGGSIMSDRGERSYHEGARMAGAIMGRGATMRRGTIMRELKWQELS